MMPSVFGQNSEKKLDRAEHLDDQNYDVIEFSSYHVYQWKIFAPVWIYTWIWGIMWLFVSLVPALRDRCV